jgi:hypothetical protein
VVTASSVQLVLTDFYSIVRCPRCDSRCLINNMPTKDSLPQTLAALFRSHLGSVNLARAFVVDVGLAVPLRFSNPQHPANPAHGHVNLQPVDRPVHVAEDGTRYYLEEAPEDRWYVVIRGIGYHGVLHGAMLWDSIVVGAPNAKGFQMPTRASAEHAYRVAAGRGDLRILPVP